MNLNGGENNDNREKLSIFSRLVQTNIRMTTKTSSAAIITACL